MQVSATTWNALSELLDEALDLDPSARAIWIEQLSMTQPALAPSVRKLLEAHASSETADVLARLPTLNGTAAAVRVSALAAGDRIGPYRLKHEIGSGGMADVWLAERADGAFAREVALKLPLINRLRRDLALRFARERDILARLEHPHIARLYDAGVTDDGLPYLAMEYVDGQSIIEYCDQRKLDIQERLELFRQVLDAVQFAHANLIIHRDLKPTNILVTAEGQVRLLDFGIAKLLTDDDTAHETQLTQLSGRALTPDYASPEQIKGEPLTIATDIYSLGVVLYELLVGQRPYRLKVKSAAQLEQAIVNAEPVRASAAVAAECANARSTTPQRLARLLSGDLDIIASKALSKAPLDRYRTAAAFADDLDRHRSGRPVHAQPASWAYRTRKLIVRNRVAVSAATVVAVALIAAAAVSLWQANAARHQASVARREATRAEAVQKFLLDIFRTNTDQQADPIKARNTTARELLDIGAARIGEGLRDVPEAQDQVLETLAEMYWAVGLDDSAAELRRKRVAVRRDLYGPNDPRIAEALVDLARSLQSTAHHQEMPALLAEAKAIADRRLDTPEYVRSALFLELARANQYRNVTQMRNYAHDAARLMQLPNARSDELASALELEARANYWLGDWTAAVELYQRSTQENGRQQPAAFTTTLTSALGLAEIYERRAEVSTAERYYRDILAESVRINGAAHIDTVHVETRFAAFLHDTSRRSEADEIRAAILRKISESKGGDNTAMLNAVRRNTGVTLLNEGRFGEAADWIATAVKTARSVYPNSTLLASALLREARLLRERGHYAVAATTLDEALSMQTAALGPGAAPATLSRFLLAQGQLSLATGETEAAIRHFSQVISLEKQRDVRAPLDSIQAQIAVSAALTQNGQFEQSIEHAESALRDLNELGLVKYFQTLEADALLQLGRAQCASLNAANGRLNLQRSLNLRTANDHPSSPWIAEAQVALADCLLTLGDRTQARYLVQRAAAIQASHAELGEHYKRPLADVRRRLGMTAGA